jgi:hypothetical protein
MFLIDDLLFGPIKGIQFIASQIHDVLEKEMNDESVIKQELLELQLRRELEEISEDEYSKHEAEIFDRLRSIKEKQLEVMQQEVHTAGSSSMVVETKDLGDNNFWQTDHKDDSNKDDLR